MAFRSHMSSEIFASGLRKRETVQFRLRQNYTCPLRKVKRHKRQAQWETTTKKGSLACAELP